MDVVGPILFLAIGLMFIGVISSNIDLFMQRKKGVKLVEGRVPDGPVLKAGYGLMALFAFAVLSSWANDSGGFDSSTETYADCFGSMRC
jgi:hypothetical protein